MALPMLVRVFSAPSAMASISTISQPEIAATYRKKPMALSLPAFCASLYVWRVRNVCQTGVLQSAKKVRTKPVDPAPVCGPVLGDPGAAHRISLLSERSAVDAADPGQLCDFDPGRLVGRSGGDPGGQFHSPEREYPLHGRPGFCRQSYGGDLQLRDGFLPCGF